jgi:dihydroflavonol-4-reductase
VAGKVGQSYIAGNQNLDYKEFFALASKVMGITPPRIKIPKPIALAVGLGQSAMAVINGSPPLLSFTAARIGCKSFYYDPGKARKELSMPSTPIETAVLESFLWLRDHGYLEKSL